MPAAERLESLIFTSSNPDLNSLSVAHLEYPFSFLAPTEKPKPLSRSKIYDFTAKNNPIKEPKKVTMSFQYIFQ